MATTTLNGLLRSLRTERALTIEELAALSGVSVRTIGDIERGVRTAPHLKTLAALATALRLGESARAEFLAVGKSVGRPDDPARTVGAARPHRLWDFTGRAAELRAVEGLLKSDRTHGGAGPPIVLSGLPGAGKTSLALEAVRRSGADAGSYFVNLLGASEDPLSPLEALQVLLRQRPAAGEVPTAIDEAVAEWRRTTAVGNGVVVLDDAGSESQIRAVIDVGPGFRVLITSRRALPGLEAAHHITIGPLSRPESVSFLRAAIRAEQRTDEDVRELARLTGDLPLALRVLASRIAAQPSLSTADLVQRLGSEARRLRQFSAGELEVERAFAASYALLTVDQQRTFRHLSLLPATSFPAAVAGATRGVGRDDALESLEELAELGLVEHLGGDRYRLHDLLRLFAASRFDEEDAHPAVMRGRVSHWYLDGAARSARLFIDEEDSAAAETGGHDDAPSNRAEAAIWLRDEADGWYSALLALAAAKQDDELLRYAGVIQNFMEAFIDWGRWHEFFRLAVTAAHRIGDQREEARSLAGLAYAYNDECFDEECAIAAGSAAVRLADDIDEPAIAGQALATIAMAERRRGAQDRAEQALRLAAARYAGAGDLDGELNTRYLLSDWQADTDPKAAEAGLREVLARLRTASPGEVTHRDVGIQEVLLRLAHVHLITGRPQAAIGLAAEGGEVVPHYPGGLARARALQGLARLALGDSDEALVDLRAALEIVGDHRPQFWADRVATAIRAAEQQLEDHVGNGPAER